MSLEESHLFFGRSKTVTLVPTGASATLQEGSGYEIRDSFQGGDSRLPWSLPGTLLTSIDVADQGSFIVFPQVPATVPTASQEASQDSRTILPPALSQPLQKATKLQLQHKDSLQVYTSGLRSAIYAHGDELYRLKGCGNGVQNSDIHHSFPVRYLSSDAIRDALDTENPLEPEELLKEIEVRGAMFDFTARREQAITSLVNSAIQQKGIPAANIPAGYYRYADMKVKTADESVQTVSLCCGLYQTYGDKRLASHLLWGLELLLPLVFKELVPPPQVQPTTEDSSTETSSNEAPAYDPSWCYARFDKGRVMGTEVLDTGFAALEGADLLTNLLELPIGASALNDLSSPPTLPQYADTAAWSHIWDHNWTQLLSNRDKLGNAFAAIYWSIGRQAGKIVRAIHDANINWGTYEDLLGNHCNSHPNNLLVLQQPSNSYFLAPLDFDLAFTRQSFQPAKATNSAEAQPLWDELREMEANAMNLALGGLNLNSGVEGRADLPVSIDPIRIALRDTMVKASMGAYAENEDAFTEPVLALEAMFQPLIRLALILSENITA